MKKRGGEEEREKGGEPGKEDLKIYIYIYIYIFWEA